MVKFLKTARQAYEARQETRKEMRKNTGGKNRIRRFLYGGMAFSALACCALLLTGLLYSGSGRAMPFGLQNPHDRGIAEKQAEQQSRAVAAAAELQRVLREPEIRKNDVFLFLGPWWKHHHKSCNV